MHLVAHFDNAFQIVWNLLAAMLTLWAVLLVALTPVGSFRHGWRTKIFWWLVALGLWSSIAGYVNPLGALLALYAIRTQRERSNSARPSDPRSESRGADPAAPWARRSSTR